MIYIRPTQSGYDAYDLYHEELYSEKNCCKLFSFVESDTTKIKELLCFYFDTIIDVESLTIKEKQPAKKLVEGIKKEMKRLHPYLASNRYITVFCMLAEHLNRQIIEKSGELPTKDIYAELLRALVMPLYTLEAKRMPPSLIPTSNAFRDNYYKQLQQLQCTGEQSDHVSEHSNRVSGLDYIEEIRNEAERYIYWVLDRSCFRFRDLEKETRIRLYSRIFREGIIGPDIRMEHCCYWLEPEQYDYFSNTPTGRLLNEELYDVPAETALSRVMEHEQEKRCRNKMVTILRNITSDTFDFTQDMKEFMNEELDAARDDTAPTMLEEYRVDSFDQLIRTQLWLLSKADTIIKRCRYCGRLFIAERLSSDYCNRIKGGETEACDVVGPRKSFARLMEEDHILKVYNRVYKTIYARKKRGSISDDEFIEWKTEARSLLNKTRAGGMSEDDFEAWLKQDVRAWGAFGKEK